MPTPPHPSSTSGGSTRRRGATDPNALDVVRIAFDTLVSAADPLAVDGRLFAGWPARPVPLDEVRARLLDRECPQSMRDAVWAHLVIRARNDAPEWTVGAVGVALPGLTASAARLTARFAGDPSDVHAEVLAAFLAALDTVDIGRPRIMVRLRWAAYRGGHAALMAALRTPQPVDVALAPPTASPSSGNPDVVLQRAVTDGAITATDAALIGETRLEDTSIETWAQAHHASTIWAVYKARRRAELRLRDYLLGVSPASASIPERDPEPNVERADASNYAGRRGVEHDPTAVTATPSSKDPRCA